MRVEIDPITGCHLWLGALTTNGYGYLAIGGKRHKVHHLAFKRRHGKIPRGKQVLHTCDVRNCFNPDHLYAGTQLQNVRDMVERKRHCWGERHKDAKLSAADVVAIRASKEKGVRLAEVYGVKPPAISMIRNGRLWKLLPGCPREPPKDTSRTGRPPKK